MSAIRQNKRDILVDEWCLLDSPIQLQDEVAIFAVAPERFVTLRLAAGIVIDDAIDDLPVAVVSRGHFPAAKVVAVEERDKSVGHSRRASP